MTDSRKLLRADEVLAPCPFCDGADIRIDRHTDMRSPTGAIFSMCCYNCGATFPNRYKRELLVEAWNRREGRALPHTNPDGEVAALREAKAHWPLATPAEVARLPDDDASLATFLRAEHLAKSLRDVLDGRLAETSCYDFAIKFVSHGSDIGVFLSEPLARRLYWILRICAEDDALTALSTTPEGGDDGR